VLVGAILAGDAMMTAEDAQAPFFCRDQTLTS